MITATNQGNEDINSRINAACVAFCRLRTWLWCRSEIKMHTKDRIYQSLVRTTLLCSCDTYSVRAKELRKLECSITSAYAGFSASPGNILSRTTRSALAAKLGLSTKFYSQSDFGSFAIDDWVNSSVKRLPRTSHTLGRNAVVDR